LLVGTPATQACRQATTEIPIVFAGVTEPVELGFADSLSQPGRNLTGLSFNSPEVSGKRVELLKEAMPKLARLAVLSNPGNPASAPKLKEVQSAARTLGLGLKVLEARASQDLKHSFAVASVGRSEAVVLLGDAMVFANL
jgi:putative tryptophan/tyrosine transport system substrate-binding protein